MPARCVSFIDADDFTRLRSLSFSDGVDRATVHKLLETVFLGRDRKARSALAALAPGGGGAGEPRDAEGGPEKFGRDSNPNANENRDSGNEVAEPTAVGALIVQQLEREMDMRGEVIETVLSCLELWDARVVERRCAEASEKETKNKKRDASRATLAATETASSACPAKNSENGDDDFGARGDGNGLVRVLPDMRATCELSFHGASPEALAGVCPLVAAVLALGAKPKAGTYRFSVAAAARSMRSGLEEVGAQLQALSANGDAAYRLSDRAVGYEILRAPPADLRPLASALAAHLAAVERSAVHKLDTVYAALERAANAEDDHAQSASLRGTLEAYLRGTGPGSAGTPSGVDLSGVIAADAPRGLAADVRELLTHRSGGKAGGAGCMSARAVARVLHGLGSPAYPAAEWRRKEKAGNLWEKHSGVDFGAIVRVASEELLAMRGVVPKKKPP